jgi:hypothetical protein
MFNSTVVEVAIGLIFIYVLYSLLATTIQEFIASLFSYRARMLEKGLEQMLDGTNFSYYWWDRLWNWLNKSNKTKATGKFHKKKNLFTNAISCHPLYIRSGENSNILKNKKPSYLSADVFSDILIDVLKPNKDIPALLKDIAASVKSRAQDENDPLNSDLEKILMLYIEQADGDLQRFRLLTENWYNDTMDRVGGWYKRQTNRILIGIGLCLAITFKVSTIDIVKELSADKEVRTAFVTNATDLIKGNIEDGKPLAKGTVDTLKRVMGQNITETVSGDTTFDALRSKVERMKALYQNNIAEANTTLGLGWGNFGVTNTTEGLRWYEKLWYIFRQTLTTPHYWIGFIITAFAISLGAPFWFDLLNRFVNLRVGGAKPDDRSSAAPVSKTS